MRANEEESTLGYADRWTTVRVDVDEGVAWVELNRPEKRNAMVNGWCFGGAFTPLVACDLAIAADDATFGDEKRIKPGLQAYGRPVT